MGRAAPVAERLGDRQGAGVGFAQAAGLHGGSTALEVADASQGAASRLPAVRWTEPADGRRVGMLAAGLLRLRQRRHSVA